MDEYKVFRGRKKIVQRFSIRQGIWILAIIGAAFLATLVLWLVGVARFDVD